MVFTIIYDKLYQHWLKEFRQMDLTFLNNELLSEYKKILMEFDKNEITNEDSIKKALKDTYRKNYDYLLNDFLKMREIKIINASLILQEIDLNILMEAEKLFYQNLVGAIKGFEKVKSIFNYDVFEKKEQEEIIPAEILSKEINGSSKNSINDVSKEKAEEFTLQKDIKDFNYTLIKFLKEASPLVGIDLINYGPFEKEDIAFLPFENAKILIYEKFAEKIDLS